MTQKEIFRIIEEELHEQNVKTTISEDEIIWLDHYGAENLVSGFAIAIGNNEMLAWWQQNEVGNDQVKMRIRKDLIVTWRPPLNTMSMPSSGASFIEFCGNSLILKYRDKHRARIFIFNINTLRAEEIFSEGFQKVIKLIGNELFIRDYLGDEILKITIYPEYFEKENIDHDYLITRNINLD
ncbi:hypothetical protein [Chryseobacterium sp. JUb7]|uniref:hypothetical protein n=1 Tax=Chryseobacterium sp. JUb7 TaxID=2940599 RepID=UPI002167260E|nr:hypothetical protein [Chryseobacterium sp. JUb7]MCS3531452.1 hypothetical protein [Chryseobacterium sp. JUb7]